MEELIGMAVSIPELNEEGIICGFDDKTRTFVVETDYGWIEGLKKSQIEPVIAHRATEEHEQRCSM